MSYSVNQLESKEKQKVRKIIIDTVKRELKTCDRALTLPNLNFTVEHSLIKEFGTIVECVENDPKIYNRQLALPITNKIFFYNRDVFAHLQQTKYSYEFLWLDLCGALQLRVKNNLLSLIQSDKLKDNCIIALTTQRGREHHASHITMSTGASLECYRSSGLIEDLQFYAQQVGRKVKLLKEINYKSELQSIAAPMKTLIIKTTKN